MTLTDIDRKALRLARAATHVQVVEPHCKDIRTAPIEILVDALVSILGALRERAPEIIHARELHRITVAIVGLQQGLSAALPILFVVPPVSTRRN